MADIEYSKAFDANHYLKTYYTGNPLHVYDVAIKMVYDIYNSEKFKGGSLLDVCTGPVVTWLTAASRKYTDITVSDLVEGNRLEIKKWLHNAPDAFDWTSGFRLAADIEGDSDHTIVEERLRRAVKHVIPCDVHKENPLMNVCKQFDAIQCCYGIESASHDQESLQRNLKNLHNVLKPGGPIVLLSTLETTYYYVGPECFPCLYITKELLADALKGAGFEDIEVGETFGANHLSVYKDMYNSKGSFLCTAFKKL